MQKSLVLCFGEIYLSVVLKITNLFISFITRNEGTETIWPDINGNGKTINCIDTEDQIKFMAIDTTEDKVKSSHCLHALQHCPSTVLSINS